MPATQSSTDTAASVTTSDNGPESGTDQENPFSTRKRVFEILADSLSQTGRKKKHKKDDVLLPYVRAGRWIPRAFSPFINITSMFWLGIAASDGCDAEQESENEFISQFTIKERDHLAKVYDDVLDIVPGFREQMSNFRTDPEALDNIIDVMTDAAKGARSDDTGGLKMKAVLYIPLKPRQDACVPPITNEKSKSDRGFNHPMVSHLLCPRKLLDEFDVDPEAMRAKFLDGTIKIVADDWPSFLYEEGVYDPDEIDKGLLRGYFLLRVFRHLFTSPSSALKDTSGTNATRSGNAKLHKMTRVTPATIAYAAVQARFVLSTAEVWGPEDGDFNLEDFHAAIMQLFEPEAADPADDEWARTTLAWWDKAVFRFCAVQTDALPPICDISNTNQLSDRARLLAQRAARRGRLANSEPNT